jgi:ATP-dependent DNA helicase RecG
MGVARRNPDASKSGQWLSFNLKMVDTAGGGIRKMFIAQRKRFFPMPDYNLSDNRVEVTLIGKVLDLNYARLLASDGGLTLEEIMLLDCVQKQQPLTADQIASLRSKQLIEGRKPNFFIAKSVAQKTGQKVQYSKNKGLTNEQVESFILKALTEHAEMERAEIDRMVWDILPAWMDEKKKRTRVENLLRVLRESGKITNHRNGPKSIWRLAPSTSE